MLRIQWTHVFGDHDTLTTFVFVSLLSDSTGVNIVNTLNVWISLTCTCTCGRQFSNRTSRSPISLGISCYDDP